MCADLASPGRSSWLPRARSPVRPIPVTRWGQGDPGHPGPQEPPLRAGPAARRATRGRAAAVPRAGARAAASAVRAAPVTPATPAMLGSPVIQALAATRAEVAAPPAPAAA